MKAAGPVIALDHPAALDAGWVGTLAAELARGRATGLAVRPGIVLTRDWTWSPADRAIARHAWRILSEDGRHPLVVRPSPVGTPGDGADAHPCDALVAGDEHEFFAALAAVRGPAVEVGTPPPGPPDVAVLLQPLPGAPQRALLTGTAA